VRFACIRGVSKVFYSTWVPSQKVFQKSKINVSWNVVSCEPNSGKADVTETLRICMILMLHRGLFAFSLLRRPKMPSRVGGFLEKEFTFPFSSQISKTENWSLSGELYDCPDQLLRTRIPKQFSAEKIIWDGSFFSDPYPEQIYRKTLHAGSKMVQSSHHIFENIAGCDQMLPRIRFF
jgi:hypothetical protein